MHRNIRSKQWNTKIFFPLYIIVITFIIIVMIISLTISCWRWWCCVEFFHFDAYDIEANGKIYFIPLR